MASINETPVHEKAAEQVLRLVAVRDLARSGRARQLRRDAGLSIYDVARAVGVAAPTIHRWELGLRRPHGDAALRYEALLDALARQTEMPG